MNSREWLDAFADLLGVAAPDDETVDALLAIASAAAHDSERVAAPVACYVVGLAGRIPADVLDLARSVADGRPS